MKNKIGIDVRMGQWTGIGRYIQGLVSSLSVKNGFYYTLFGPQKMKHLRQDMSFIETNTPVYGLREQFYVAWDLRDTDLLHIPNFNGPLAWPKKLIITIHDLTLFHYPDQLSSSIKQFYIRTFLPLILKRADAIIAVSNYTKRDLIQTFNIDPKKIHVIYHGVEKCFLTSRNCRLIRQNYLLYIGLIKKHKNVGLLLDVFEKIKKTNTSDLKLKIVGKPDLKQSIVHKWMKRIQSNPDIIHDEYLDDIKLKQAYLEATALVFPSKFEGFGFPVLEAMSLGTPVIASRVTSIPEVLGDAGLSFDPNSLTELESKINQLLSSNTLAHKLSEKGKERSLQFTWDQAAKKSNTLYQTVLHAN